MYYVSKSIVDKKLLEDPYQRHGFTEDAILDILSGHEQLLDDVFQYHAPRVRRIPELILKRLLHEIDESICRPTINGHRVIRYFHRQFHKFFKQFRSEQQYRLATMYFNGTLAINYPERKINANQGFDALAVSELPFLLLKTTNYDQGYLEELKTRLMDVSHIQHRIRYGQLQEYLDDCEATLNLRPNITSMSLLHGLDRLQLVVKFLQSKKNLLESYEDNDQIVTELYRLTHGHECFIKHNDLFSVKQAPKLNQTLLIMSSPFDSVEISSFGIQKPRPTMAADSIMIEVINSDQLIVAVNFTDRDDPNIKSHMLSMWNGEMEQIFEVEHVSIINDMQLFDSCLYVLTAFELIIYESENNKLLIKQRINLPQKSGKFCIDEDQFCLVDERQLKIYEFFDFNGKINLDDRLCIYKTTKSPQNVCLDPVGVWLAVSSEIDIKVYATETLDCVYTHKKSASTVPSSISWSGNLMLLTDGKQLKSVKTDNKFTVHKSLYYPNNTIINGNAEIQLFHNEIRLAVSNFGRTADNISFVFEHKRIDIKMQQNMPIMNGKIVLIGENARLLLVEKQKIIENQKLTRRNPVIAVRQVEFGEKNQFLPLRKKFMITLANNESFFTIYNDKFDEWGRLKCIRGYFYRKEPL